MLSLTENMNCYNLMEKKMKQYELREIYILKQRKKLSILGIFKSYYC